MSLLIVEDDPNFVELIQRALQRPRTVRFATTLTEAHQRIAELKPEVILLDLTLPDSSPDHTMAEIAKLKEESGAKIIVVSGYGEIKSIMERATKAGALTVLSKDDGIFTSLSVALLYAGHSSKRCASESTVLQIEHTVGKIVSGSPWTIAL